MIAIQAEEETWLNERMEPAGRAMSLALKRGTDEAAATVSHNRRISATFRDGKPEELKEANRKSLSLKLFIDNGYSVHSTNDFRKDDGSRGQMTGD